MGLGGAEATPVITVVLVDDHEIVRRGLRGVLEEAGDIAVLGEAAGVESGLALIERLRPDVAVVDLRLADGSGIDLCREVSERAVPTATLMLTAHDDVAAVEAAVLAGASGYVLKQLRGTRLVESVRQVAAGERVMDPTLAIRVMERARDRMQHSSDLERLTAQEGRILELIGHGLTNREISHRMGLAEKTVKNYVSAILAKLGLSSRTQAALFLAKHQGS